MEKIENILTDCIRDIKSGKVTLAECLDHYDSRREELEPLIKMALNIQEPPGFNLDSSYKQAAKAQLLHQIRGTKQKKLKSFTDILSFGIPYQLRWARVAVSVLAVIIMMSILAGGTAYAAQSSLPGDFLYAVKVRTEDTRLLIAAGDSAKAELSLKFAQMRLDEMNELMKTGSEKVELAIDGYKRNLDSAVQHIRRIRNSSDQTNLLIQSTENMQYQLVFCDSVTDNNPAFSEQVNKAGNLAVDQQVQVLEILSQLNIQKASQINFDAMENRIQRAQVKANGNQYQTMEEALLQYQQFNQLGEHILHTAQASNNHNTEIETLSIQALSGYLDILDSISQKVPQQYQKSIETCKQMTMQFQTQARYSYQGQNTPDDGPDSGSNKPDGSADKPDGGAGEPGSGTGEPGSGAGEPGADPDEPGSGTGEPGSGTGEPGSGAGKPGNGADEPGKGAG
ncbi:DUF5667 domain-containing protein [Chloroflexota bacterium]